MLPLATARTPRCNHTYDTHTPASTPSTGVSGEEALKALRLNGHEKFGEFKTEGAPICDIENNPEGERTCYAARTRALCSHRKHPR